MPRPGAAVWDVPWVAEDRPRRGVYTTESGGRYPSGLFEVSRSWLLRAPAGPPGLRPRLRTPRGGWLSPAFRDCPAICVHVVLCQILGELAEARVAHPLSLLSRPPRRSHHHPQDRCGLSVISTCWDRHSKSRGPPCPRLDGGSKREFSLALAGPVQVGLGRITCFEPVTQTSEPLLQVHILGPSCQPCKVSGGRAFTSQIPARGIPVGQARGNFGDRWTFSQRGCCPADHVTDRACRQAVGMTERV